jgi:hypothetical protein
MLSFLYKLICLCFNKSVLYWTFCQSLLRSIIQEKKKNPIVRKYKEVKCTEPSPSVRVPWQVSHFQLSGASRFMPKASCTLATFLTKISAVGIDCVLALAGATTLRIMTFSIKTHSMTLNKLCHSA